MISPVHHFISHTSGGGVCLRTGDSFREEAAGTVLRNGQTKKMALFFMNLQRLAPESGPLIP
jgi:hypothetical protein